MAIGNDSNNQLSVSYMYVMYSTGQQTTKLSLQNKGSHEHGDYLHKFEVSE